MHHRITYIIKYFKFHPHFIMYADDTTLTSTLENFGGVNDEASLERELNQEITKVYSWLLSNKLTLNQNS